ncbi:MAG: major capsid protein [Bacillota bacterium]|nr:major capsid protein [Bacillota bacterium]
MDITALGFTVLTELAKTFENFDTTVGQFFPSRNIPAKTVRIERIYGGVGMAPIVDPTKPDGFADRRTMAQQDASPVYSRESFPLAQDTINNLRQPGTLNERYGKSLVADEIKRLVARSDLLFDFLRTQMLLGGINYTDPRTNQTLNVAAGLPADHVVNAGTAWPDLANAKPIDDIEAWKLKIRNDGYVEPTHIFMTSVTRSNLSRNAQVLARGESARDTGFVTFANGELMRIAGLEVVVQDTVYEELSAASAPTATVEINDASIAEGDTITLAIGDVSSGTYTAVTGDTAANIAAHMANFINGNPAMPVTATVAGAVITLGLKDPRKDQSLAIVKTGTIDAVITGSPLVVTSSGLVKTVKKMIPDNKVVICCKAAAGEPLGRTDFVIGEHPQGQPGIWSRAQETAPPNPPGVLIQVGRAGLPYVRYPEWIVVATVA